MELKKNSLRQELEAVCRQIQETKSTNCLYEFKSVIDKCVENKSTILHRDLLIECLSRLEKTVPSKLLESLLQRAVELNDYEMCVAILNNVQILQEHSGIRILKYFLREIETSEDMSSFSIDTVTESKLDLIFTKKFDYHFLTQELKQLSSQEFIACLLYLQNYLKTAFQSNNIELDKQAEQVNQKPTILQITELFSCFVDAHFTHITLSNKAQEIIAEVLQLIETQLDVFVDILSIESLIKEVKNNKDFRINTESNLENYYIEVLKL